MNYDLVLVDLGFMLKIPESFRNVDNETELIQVNGPVFLLINSEKWLPMNTEELLSVSP